MSSSTAFMTEGGQKRTGKRCAPPEHETADGGDDVDAAAAVSRRAGKRCVASKPESHPMPVGLGELPTELLEHVTRFALEDGLIFAATSRLLRGAVLRAAGAASIFQLIVLVANRRIAGDDIVARMQLVKRALVAGHCAQLFTWPPADPRPLPSPLREHICRNGGATAHSLPLEHNLTVHISDPTDEDAAPFLNIHSIVLYRLHGSHWLPGHPVQSMHVNLDTSGGVAPFEAPFQWHPRFLGQLCLQGKTGTVGNVNSRNAGGHQCCRRMAIVLRPRV